MRIGMIAMICGTTLAVGGCFVGPDHLAEARLTSPDEVTARKDRWWATANAPTITQAARVAIVEFSIEYVTVKKLGLFGTRPIVDVQEFSITGGAAHLAGIGREKLVLDDEAMRTLPGELYASFVEQLTAAGLDVLPTEHVIDADSLSHIGAFDTGESLDGMFLSPAGSDTGRPKEIRIFSAAPLRALRGDSTEINAAAARAANALGANYALRVVVRLGADNGYASIERESHITVIPCNGFTDPLGAPKVYAVRSLLSDGRIATSENFELLSGTVTTADANLYKQEVRTLAEPFLAMGLSSIGGLTPPRGSAGVLPPRNLVRGSTLGVPPPPQ